MCCSLLYEVWKTELLPDEKKQSIVFWMWISIVRLQKNLELLATCNLSEQDKKLFSKNKKYFSPLHLFKSVFADIKVWHPWSSHKHLSSFEDFDKLDFKRDRSIHQDKVTKLLHFRLHLCQARKKKLQFLKKYQNHISMETC